MGTTLEKTVARKSWHTARWGGLLKVAAVALLLLAAPFAWSGIFLERVQEMRVAETPIRLIKFVLAFGACLVVLAIIPFLQSNRLRWAAASVLAIGIAIDQCMVAIFGRHYALDLSMLAWVDRANASLTLPEYSAIIAKAVTFALAIGVVYALPPPRRLAIANRPTLAFVALTYVGSSALLWAAKSTNYDLPAPIAWPAIAIQTLVTATHEQTTPRLAVSQSSEPGLRRFRHIVFIVDESVRGDRLGLNNPNWDTTPFLSEQRASLVNFGVASSGTNCSGTSRMIMRFGARPEQLPDTTRALRSQSTIWQFAQKAGYKTIHVDPFRIVGNFHSGMNAIESKSIDEMVSVASLPMPEQDPAIAKLLPGLLARKEPSLIYVNKNGVHPVFSKQYPDTLDYEPSGMSGLPLDQAQRDVIRHYHRALRWSVDGFFKDAWAALSAPDVLVVYTSDHGLALFEGGHAATHCSTLQSAIGEGLVPLFVIAGDPQVAAQLRLAQATVLGRASHFDVFPTLLWAMGYPRPWVTATYGPGLMDPSYRKPRRFWTGPLETMGAVSWVPVDGSETFAAVGPGR